MAEPRRKAPKSDLTDAQWEAVAPLLPAPKPTRRPREADLREVLDTLLCHARTRCPWDRLPHDLLPKGTVCACFAAWQQDGTWQRIRDPLRAAVRQAAGRSAPPRRPASAARPSSPPRGEARPATTAASASRGGNATSPWMPWGC